MTNRQLTRNQQLVFSALTQEETPLSAYALLDRLRDEGVRAPLQVYRALEKLTDYGLVHKLESLNAFVVCRHPHCAANSWTAFAICDKCGVVNEFSDDKVEERLAQWAEKASFTMEKTTIELRGACAACRAALGVQ